MIAADIRSAVKIILMAVLFGAFLNFGGCIAVTAELSDGTKIMASRLMSDVSVDLYQADGPNFKRLNVYSSMPSAVAQTDRLGDAVAPVLIGVMPATELEPEPLQPQVRDPWWRVRRAMAISAQATLDANNALPGVPGRPKAYRPLTVLSGPLEGIGT